MALRAAQLVRVASNEHAFAFVSARQVEVAGEDVVRIDDLLAEIGRWTSAPVPFQLCPGRGTAGRAPASGVGKRIFC